MSNRESVIVWKNAEVTIEQDGENIVILLFANDICVGKAIRKGTIKK